MWQPISTAPRDGTLVDLWGAEYGDRIPDAYWHTHENCWWAPSMYYDLAGPIYGNVTHWMPNTGGT
jgi:hypothetical protein